MINDYFLNSLIGAKEKTMSKLSTGNKVLDTYLDGGYKTGSLTEITGDSGVGKTMLAIMAIKECQRRGKIALYIDTQYALNLDILKNNDIDPETLLIINNNEADVIGPIISKIVIPNKEDIGLIAIDDIASLTIKKEKTSTFGSNSYKLRSKIIKSLMIRLANICRNTDISCLVLNQLRSEYRDNVLQENSISAFENIVSVCCETRVSLSLKENGETEINIKRKERRLSS